MSWEDIDVARGLDALRRLVAHTLLDVVAFVGYALLRDRLSWL